MNHLLLFLYAALLIGVFIAWGSCLLGAVALPAYLLWVAVRARRALREGPRRVPSEPPTVLITVLVIYALVMAASATFFAASIWYRGDLAAWQHPSASALKWAALPAWSSLTAAATVTVLRRRRLSWRAIRSEPHG